ncbi:MAG: hypothetical protein BGO07_02250 [Alphaproteobacteria bacterium 40-19]|nr:MAG: hypothetical protein BGO07_02250 [Alphaproteobacteria bacterium 40-19]
MFAKLQAVEPEAPAVAQQAAAVQQWQSVFGTHYPIIEEIKSISFRDSASLLTTVNTIVCDKLTHLPKYLGRNST